MHIICILSAKKLQISTSTIVSIACCRYVYERLTPAGKRPGFPQLLATQLVSGVWHGLYPGYLIFFASSALMLQARWLVDVGWDRLGGSLGSAHAAGASCVFGGVGWDRLWLVGVGWGVSLVRDWSWRHPVAVVDDEKWLVPNIERAAPHQIATGSFCIDLSSHRMPTADLLRCIVKTMHTPTNQPTYPPHRRPMASSGWSTCWCQRACAPPCPCAASRSCWQASCWTTCP